MTWRLAARFADELNLNGLDPDEVAQSIPIIQRRCAETGRDPGTLRISVHLWGDLSHRSGSIRVKRLATYRELGVGRVIAQLHEAVGSDAVLESLADDARHAGVIHEA